MKLNVCSVELKKEWFEFDRLELSLYLKLINVERILIKYLY